MIAFAERWLYRLIARQIDRQTNLESLYPCSCQGCHYDCGTDICGDPCWLGLKVEDDGPRLCYRDPIDTAT
jgi:hypothetical protein